MKRIWRLRGLWLVVVLAACADGRASWAETIARCGEGYLERKADQMVLHVKGTPYQMGYQHGALLKEQCRSLVHELFDVKQKDVTVEFFGLKLTPEQVIARIFELQKKYIPKKFIEEMEGLADGAGLPREKVLVANSLPELFHCSGFALLKEVTTVGTLLHGRVLDYGIDWRLQEHAVLVIAEPQDGIPFANVSYAGLVGSVTGMNRAQVSIGEMGGRGVGKWNGVPMTVLVRRVLEEAQTLDQAIAIFRDSPRTCEYYYVIADAKSNRAVGMDAGADRFTLIHPGQSHELLPTPVPNTVLMSAGERYKNLCRLVQTVADAKERFSVEKAIRLMDAPVAMRSNLHNVLFAPGMGKLWVAHASADQKPAWSQPYREHDLKALLAQPRPTSGRELPAPPVPLAAQDSTASGN